MAHQPPLAHTFLTWFTDGLCRDHAQFLCRQCVDEHRYPDAWNTNDFPHPAPHIARANARMARRPQENEFHRNRAVRIDQNRPVMNVRVRWTGEDRSVRLTDPDSTLMDVLRSFDANGLRVDFFERGMRYTYPGVPLNWTLGRVVEAVGGNVLLVMHREPWC